MVRRLTQIQALAASLFLALSKYSACTCRPKHSAMARLESRIPTQGAWQKRGKKLEPTIFDIVLPFEDSVFQQASVNAMVVHENMSMTWYVTLDTLRMLLIYLLNPQYHSRSSSVSPQLPALSFRPGAQYIGPVFPLPSQPCNRSEIKDLCRSARDAWEKGDLLHLELVADMLQVALTGDRSPSHLAKITTHITLKDFLIHGWEHDETRLTPRQQTHFAFDIASSMLQFQRTNWFSSAWNSKTIKFLVANTANNRYNKNTTAIVGVFVEQELQLSVQQQQSAGIPGTDPQTALLELAILLLEIWHHIPLEVWASRAQTEVQTLDHRKIAATRWLQSTSERLPPDYLTAIEQCLAICSGRLRYWEDREFQRYYCENILKPLLESCQAWVG